MGKTHRQPITNIMKELQSGKQKDKTESKRTRQKTV